MRKLYTTLLSMPIMVFLLLILAIVIGAATFIENDFGTKAAMTIVYRSWWFNVLFIWLGIILLHSLITRKFIRKRKYGSFIFHLAFIIILIGAGVTRFFGEEGTIHLRNQKEQNHYLSRDRYIKTNVIYNNINESFNEELYLSQFNVSDFKQTLDLLVTKYKLSGVRYIPNAVERVVINDGGKPYILLNINDNGSSNDYFLSEDTPIVLENTAISLNQDINIDNYIKINLVKEIPIITFPDTSYIEGNNTIIFPQHTHQVEEGDTYKYKNIELTVKTIIPSGIKRIEINKDTDIHYPDIFVVEAKHNNEVKKLILRNYDGSKGTNYTVMFEDKSLLTMSYGAIEKQLPFTVQLNKFTMYTYPGSSNPYSYESDITISNGNVSNEYTVAMNKTVDYHHYRFFQTSFDEDEQGSILSINHDWWGTNISYLGYFLMIIGMIISFVRMVSTKKSVTTIIILLLIGNAVPASVIGQTYIDKKAIVPKAQSSLFGEIYVQDMNGRIKPMNTYSSELLRKIHKSPYYQELNSDQVILSMITFPDIWKYAPIMSIKHRQLKRLFETNKRQISYAQVFDPETGTYLLYNDLQKIMKKKPSERSKLEQEIISLDEKINVCYYIYSGQFLHIFPDPNDINHPWYSFGQNINKLTGVDSLFVTKVFPFYIKSLHEKKYTKSTEIITGVIKFQEKYAKDILPSPTHKTVEILYNHLNIFQSIIVYYLVIGLIFLVINIIAVFRNRNVNKWVNNVFIAFFIILFVIHTIGLAMRWYISGHAPWSNGYESLIYISWTVIFAGIVFSRNSRITIAGTAVLCSLILGVAHLSWINPEVTPLVPVLRSYWLTLHVSIIISSYGFFTLSAILGIINLLLNSGKTKDNYHNISLSIQRLTNINNNSMTLGLYLVTIGTFLGGIWANESWGRYWGWDPKESWALITAIIYALIAHLKYIKSLKSTILFNLLSVLGFSTVLMTYFGVNYYLTGLHSYAGNESPNISPVACYSLIIILILFFISLWKNHKYKEISKPPS
ncbi:MAG: c-type cytochrome biogenesis protein CcsB [Hyphomicrobiales bacterium]